MDSNSAVSSTGKPSAKAVAVLREGRRLMRHKVKIVVDSMVACAALAALSTAITLLFASSRAYAQCAGSNLTLVNKESFPIWLGETVSYSPTNFPILVPSGSNWEIMPNNSVTLCAPTTWLSGTFWARTGCDFTGTFGQDPDYKACNTKTDCSQSPNPHVCVGGERMVDCTGQNNAYCQNIFSAPKYQTSSICVANKGQVGPQVSYCGFSAGTVCQTGDCGNGLYQCQGTWDGTTLQTTLQAPASQFEITDSSGPNYDVSNNSGYNVPIKVDAPSGGGSSCISNSCVTDLNTVCPTNLQYFGMPAGSTVIGCEAPTNACALPSPPAGLKCSMAIPSGSGFTADGATYNDMYSAKNASNLAGCMNGNAMFSGLQGTPSCWGTADCPSGYTCVMGTSTGISGWPSSGVWPLHDPRSRGICAGIGQLCLNDRHRQKLRWLSDQWRVYLCCGHHKYWSCVRSCVQSCDGWPWRDRHW